MTLTLSLPEQMFQMANLHMMENNNYCVKLFLNPSIIVEVIYGPDRQMQVQTPNCHPDNYVLLTPSRLDKNFINYYFLLFSQCSYQRCLSQSGAIFDYHLQNDVLNLEESKICCVRKDQPFIIQLWLLMIPMKKPELKKIGKRRKLY